MALSFLGSVNNTAIDGGNVTLDLTPLSLQAGDVVVVSGSAPNRGGSEAGTSSTGWTIRGTKSSASDISCALWFKVMGATPDTSFVLTSTANAADSASCQAAAWRDADQITPWDVTPTVTIVEGQTNPNPITITTVTDGCDIAVFAHAAIDDLPATAPTGYSDLSSALANDPEDVTCMFARKAQTSAGAEDPDAFTGVALADYVVFTVAIRMSRGIVPVGTATGGSLNGSDVVLTLPTGAAQGDVVYVGVGTSSAVNGGTSSSGWTQVEQQDNTVRLTVLRKVMGSSPDANLTLVGTANANDCLSAVAITLRGVDTTTPEDVAATKTTGSSTNPDPPSITPATTGACVIPFAASRVNDPSITVQAGYSNLTTTTRDDTNDVSIALSTRSGIASVAENPAAFGGWSTALWSAISVAVRPSTGAPIQVDAATGSLVLTGLTATVDLTANKTVDAATGSLTLTGLTAGVTASDHKIVSPDAGILTLNGNTPAIVVGVNVFPDEGELFLTGLTPVIALSDHQVVSPDKGELVLTGLTALITTGDAKVVEAELGVLVLNGQTPVIQLSDHQLILPSTASLVLVGLIPDVETTGGGAATGGDEWLLRRRRRRSR